MAGRGAYQEVIGRMMTHRRGSIRWFCLLPAPHSEAQNFDRQVVDLILKIQEGRDQTSTERDRMHRQKECVHRFFVFLTETSPGVYGCECIAWLWKCSLYKITRSAASFITSRFSAFLSSAALVKLKD